MKINDKCILPGKTFPIALIFAIGFFLASCATSPQVGTGAMNQVDTRSVGTVKVIAKAANFNEVLRSTNIIRDLARTNSTRGGFEAAVESKIKSGDIPVRELTVKYEDGTSHEFNW